MVNYKQLLLFIAFKLRLTLAFLSPHSANIYNCCIVSAKLMCGLLLNWQRGGGMFVLGGLGTISLLLCPSSKSSLTMVCWAFVSLEKGSFIAPSCLSQLKKGFLTFKDTLVSLYRLRPYLACLHVVKAAAMAFNSYIFLHFQTTNLILSKCS